MIGWFPTIYKKLCIDLRSNMATTTGKYITYDPMIKIFQLLISDTIKRGFNVHWMVLNKMYAKML